MTRFRKMINKNVSVSSIQSAITICPGCNQTIKKGSVAVVLCKVTTGNPINIWIHLNCLDSLNQKIKKISFDHGAEIMAQNL